MDIKTWIYFMSKCKKLKKGRERSFLWMEQKRWRKTPAFFRMGRDRYYRPYNQNMLNDRLIESWDECS